MDEAAWLTATDPTPMLAFLRNSGRAGERKLRLFAVACCRRIDDILTDRGREAVNAAERFADSLIDRHALHAAWAAVGFPKRDYRRLASSAARAASCSPGYDGTANAAASAIQAVVLNSQPAEVDASRLAERAAQAALLRDIFGNPFATTRIDASVLRWNDGCVVRIAAGIYEERAFERMGVLHDALLDAGCNDADVLSHARDGESHARGCWLLDLLLNKG